MNKKTYLGILIIITTVLLIIGLNYLNKNNNGSTNKITGTNIIDEKGANNSSLDSDGDSLTDWEEELWKTDIHNIDSDGDGTSDGEETRLSRNPIVKGPNDKLDDNVTSQIKTTVFKPNYSNQNKNADISLRNFLESIVGSKNTEPIQNKELHDFGNTLGQVIRDHVNNNKDESAIFNSLIKASTTASVSILEKVSEQYLNVSKKIEHLNPPSKIFKIVKKLGLNYKNQSGAIKTLSEFKTLSEIPWSELQKYSKTVIDSGKNLTDIIFFFQKENISFEEYEPGSIFNLNF